MVKQENIKAENMEPKMIDQNSLFSLDKLNPIVKIPQKELVMKKNLFTEDYSVTKKVLGSGINGKVVICTNHHGEKFALKILKDSPKARREISLHWRASECEHIVNIIDVYENDTFDNMVQMFQSKMAGDGNDPDDLIVQAFKAYEFEGKIDAGMFKHALMTWGDMFSAAEVDDIFGEFEIDEDNMIESKDVIGLFVAQKEEEKKEEAPVEEAPAEEEPEEDEGAAKKN